MMAFLEFAFRDGWHFAGVLVLLVAIGYIIEAVAVGFGNALRGAK